MNYTEFLAATIESTDLVTEERLAEAFDHLDSTDSGYITVNVRLQCAFLYPTTIHFPHQNGFRFFFC